MTDEEIIQLAEKTYPTPKLNNPDSTMSMGEEISIVSGLRVGFYDGYQLAQQGKEAEEIAFCKCFLIDFLYATRIDCESDDPMENSQISAQCIYEVDNYFKEFSEKIKQLHLQFKSQQNELS